MAIVHFTGSWLPEENRLVALKGLSYSRETAGGYRGELRLGQVPAVLVSECWQDMRLLAAGTGVRPRVGEEHGVLTWPPSRACRPSR